MLQIVNQVQQLLFSTVALFRNLVVRGNSTILPSGRSQKRVQLPLICAQYCRVKNICFTKSHTLPKKYFKAVKARCCTSFLAKVKILFVNLVFCVRSEVVMHDQSCGKLRSHNRLRKVNIFSSQRADVLSYFTCLFYVSVVRKIEKIMFLLRTCINFRKPLQNAKQWATALCGGKFV